jgi:hypothetical protein
MEMSISQLSKKSGSDPVLLGKLYPAWKSTYLNVYTNGTYRSTNEASSFDASGTRNRIRSIPNDQFIPDAISV